MSILAISGSPSPRPSRSSTLLEHAAVRLRSAGLRIDRIGLRDVPAADLILVRSTSDAALAFRELVERSDAILIATPVYNASIPGGLKALLDLLPEKALGDKLVLPLASGGSAGHQLAIEYSLKPVLAALDARHVLAGVFAADADIAWPDGLDEAATMRPELEQRLDAAIDALIESLHRRSAGTRALPLRSMRHAVRHPHADSRQVRAASEAAAVGGLASPLDRGETGTTSTIPEHFPERCSA